MPILHEVDCLPRYFIVGGLVFLPLTRPWVQITFRRKEPNCVIANHLIEVPENENQEIIILSKVLAADVNFGFQGIRNGVVRTFNDVEIENLHHLAQMVRDCCGKFYTFTLHFKTRITLNREECMATENKILNQHSIQFPAYGCDETWDMKTALLEVKTIVWF